jgi:hypothetical protein
MNQLMIQITCSECGSGIKVLPTQNAAKAQCQICKTENEVIFKKEHFSDELKECVTCERKDFYQQKDFNRKIGVILFVIAAVLSIFTYGVSFIVLYVFDFILHKKLGNIVICYNCQTVYRNVKNIDLIQPFDHEMNDRIVYSGHDFEGAGTGHS